MSSRQSVRHDLDLIGAAFKCTKSSDCDNFLHKSCFSLPGQTHHKSHPNHTLTLLYSPTSKAYTCQACGEYGSSFTYNCSICQYDVHVGCVSTPETRNHEAHAHPLTLLYGSPYDQAGSVFKCDVCEETIADNLWSYYCKECDYGTHLHSCEKEEEMTKKEEGGGSKSSVNSELDTMLEAQREVEKMQIEFHLAKCKALCLGKRRIRLLSMRYNFMKMYKIKKTLLDEIHLNSFEFSLFSFSTSCLLFP